MHSDALRIAPKLPVAILLAFVPAVAQAHGQQVVFLPLGQLVALIPAAIVAWTLTRGIAARAVVVMSAVLVPFALWFLPNYLMLWWLLGSEVSSFFTGFIASTVVAVVVALSWRGLGKDRYGT